MLVFRCWLIVDHYPTSEVRRVSVLVSDKLFCVRVTLPNPKPISLGVLTDSEVPHLRHRGLCHANFPTKLCNFICEFVDGIHADVIDHWFLRMFALLHSAVGR